MRWISWLLFISLSAHAALTPDEEKAYDELEGRAFLVQLVKDKKFAEAVAAYDKMSANERSRAESLWALGEAQGGLGQWKNATATFKRSPSPKLQASLAHSYFQLKDYEACADEFRKTQLLSLSQRDHLAWFQCAEKSNRGLAELALASRDVNDDLFLARWRALRVTQLHLEAARALERYTATCRSATFYSRLQEIAEAQKTDVTAVLEMAHACLPSDKDVTLLLLQAHYKAQNGRAVARLFEKLAVDEGAYHHHVAEFMGSLGLRESSQYWRSTTPDRTALAKARAAEWVNEGNFAQTLALSSHVEPAVYDDPLRYATAYAFFKMGFVQETVQALAPIRTPSLRAQASKLQDIVVVCREQGWGCRP